MIEIYHLLEQLAKTKYQDIVSKTQIIPRRSTGSGKLRIIFRDNSYLDIRLAPSGKYSYHWEQRAQRGRILRFDNAPFHPDIFTHPNHLHNGSEQDIKTSDISYEPEIALKFVLGIVRKALKK